MPAVRAAFAVPLLSFVLLAGCATQSLQAFDMRLRDMSGSNERVLLGSMGRIPDSSYQLDDDTKILQWRWDTSYISPGWAPTYQRVGWGLWAPIGGIPPQIVRQGCIVEWTVTKGATQSYRWQGSGCTSVIIHSTPPPG
jgi:hypothetical protein